MRDVILIEVERRLLEPFQIVLKAAISCSGGKDSVASLILCHEFAKKRDDIPDITYAVYADIWFDREQGISCANPVHLDFIKNKLIPTAQSWGVDFRILSSEKDYMSVFHHRISGAVKYPEHNGMRYGFPLPGMRCALKRDCKLPTIREFSRKIGEEGLVSVVGIASDEAKRLESLRRQKDSISVLDKLGVTEKTAREICAEYGLLSPIYEQWSPDSCKKQWRDGCWCCPYAKDSEHLLVKKMMPAAWDCYVALERFEDVAYDKWNVYSHETLHERDRRLQDLIRIGA